MATEDLWKEVEKKTHVNKYHARIIKSHTTNIKFYVNIPLSEQASNMQTTVKVQGMSL